MSELPKRKYMIEIKKKIGKPINDSSTFSKYHRKYALDLLNKPLSNNTKSYASSNSILAIEENQY